MAIFDDGIKAFLEAYTYFSTTLGKGREKLAKELAEESTGVKAPEKLEPVIPGNEPIRIPSKVEKGELMSINMTFSNPLKSDFVLSKIDGTVGSKYSVLRAEKEKMFPRFTQDLQYIKDNNIALTTAQKNNILNNFNSVWFIPNGNISNSSDSLSQSFLSNTFDFLAAQYCCIFWAI